ncbi:hypothetical protein [Devosia sp. Root635]|uniref:hypothetical protein n=1 Tax=Devosia sp. Root635 TaxID=1736575 RepID=UPI0006FFA76C|nr:hypothetical protein [Devosia sp. Root635]KRA53002.1 hypothetical protein ASD80_14485 [Devosia sp. Root635]
MKPLKDCLVAAFLTVLVGFGTAPVAQAQVSGYRIEGCNVHLALSSGQVTLAAALSATGDAMSVPVSYGDALGQIRACAGSIRHHFCADRVLHEVLFEDFESLRAMGEAVATAAAGYWLDRKLGGNGIVGALIGGTAGSVVRGAIVGGQCAEDLQSLAPIAQAVYGGARFNADHLQPREVTDVIRQAAAHGVVTSEQAQTLWRYVDAVSSHILSRH